MTDREIYEEMRDPLMHFALSLVGPDHASDLVSDAVVATLQRRSLTSIEHPKAYLMQAILNRARSRGRQMERERRAMARHGPLSPSEDASAGVSDIEQTIDLLPGFLGLLRSPNTQPVS